MPSTEICSCIDMDSGQLDQQPHRNKNRLQWKSLLHANRYHSMMAISVRWLSWSDTSSDAIAAFKARRAPPEVLWWSSSTMELLLLSRQLERPHALKAWNSCLPSGTCSKIRSRLETQRFGLKASRLPQSPVLSEFVSELPDQYGGGREMQTCNRFIELRGPNSHNISRATKFTKKQKTINKNIKNQ